MPLLFCCTNGTCIYLESLVPICVKLSRLSFEQRGHAWYRSSHFGREMFIAWQYCILLVHPSNLDQVLEEQINLTRVKSLEGEIADYLQTRVVLLALLTFMVKHFLNFPFLILLIVVLYLNCVSFQNRFYTRSVIFHSLFKAASSK